MCFQGRCQRPESLAVVVLCGNGGIDYGEDCMINHGSSGYLQILVVSGRTFRSQHFLRPILKKMTDRVIPNSQ